MVGDKNVCKALEKALPRDEMLKRAELVERTHKRHGSAEADLFITRS